MNTFRTTARVVGALYLAGLVVGIGGIVLIQSVLGAPDPLSAVSANSMLLVIGAALWCVKLVRDLFPVRKTTNDDPYRCQHRNLTIVQTGK